MRVTEPMYAVDLDHFQIDCRQKEQQIRMLQSMRTNADTGLVNRLENVLNPWDRVFNPDVAYQRQSIGNGYTNWLINQHLMRLAHDCGPGR